mgnify:CR=1 FL=1
MKQIRTRYAPSPTGSPHIGNIRTALFAWLFAKSQGGRFILRLEDTDRARYVEDGLAQNLDALAWLFISPDEGPGEIGGEYGPYIQSQRLDLYQKYAQELIARKKAYYCFCTPQRLTALREEQALQKKAPRYDKHCLRLSQQETQDRLQNNEPYIIRLDVPADETLVWNDLVHGDVSFASNDVDDQVLMKSDGFPTYHLANVVDDHLMEISHVIRSDEWLSSTPKHLLLYRFFEWEAPLFAHLPLILNAKKAKLSKRDGEVALLAYKDIGYLPEAMLNFLVLLGWNPKNDQEIFSRYELVQCFDLKNINKAGAVFNLEKLNWFNGHYIRKKSVEEFTQLCLPYFFRANLFAPEGDLFRKVGTEKLVDISYIQRRVALFQERLVRFDEIVELSDFLFTDELSIDTELLAWKKLTVVNAQKNLARLKSFLLTYEGAWTKEELERDILAWIAENKLKNGDVLWPFRVALSGKKASPGPFELASVLEREEVFKSIEQAL